MRAADRRNEVCAGAVHAGKVHQCKEGLWVAQPSRLAKGIPAHGRSEGGMPVLGKL